MSNPVLLSLAAGGEHPLIDIDLTAFVQFGIFAVGFLVATKFLFRPYLRMRDQRDAGIVGARREAGELSAEADAKLSSYESKLDAARSRANEERRKIRAEAAATQVELTENARSVAADAFNKASADAQAQMNRARAELLPKADALASDIVAKLLGRKVA